MQDSVILTDEIFAAQTAPNLSLSQNLSTSFCVDTYYHLLSVASQIAKILMQHELPHRIMLQTRKQIAKLEVFALEPSEPGPSEGDFEVSV